VLRQIDEKVPVFWGTFLSEISVSNWETVNKIEQPYLADLEGDLFKVRSRLQLEADRDGDGVDCE
jgi:hypothetical protein